MSTNILNYYEVLDVATDASQDNIYKAYQSAQITFSLSNSEIFKVFSKAEANDWLELIEEAYSIIGSPNTRRIYDKELGINFSNLPSLELENTQTSSEKTLDTLGAGVDGYSSTPISQYKINKSMEEIIENQELFDGLFLKKVREYKNIDLTDFSKKTCIAIRHLYAIENNNFSVLPAAVFVRGYIIQYCRLLGLDEKKVLSSFIPLLKDA